MHYAHIHVDPASGKQNIQTGAEHARNTAEWSGSFLASCALCETGYLAGLLHDCGKFTDNFDAYLLKAVQGQDVKKGSVIHTFAGVSYLLKRFHSQDGQLTVQDMAAEVLATAIGSHHGLMDLWDEQQHDGFAHRLTKQPDYDARAAAAFHEECAAEEEIRKRFAGAQQEVLEFIQTRIGKCCKDEAEWHFALGLLVRLITSAIVDADRTDTASFMQGREKAPGDTAWVDCIRNMNTYLSQFPSDTPIQRARAAFSQACAQAARKSPGLYRLDLPTGGGKTLAALRFALEHAQRNAMHRVFYIAPLLSIIEQNADVIRSAIGDAAPVLEHHSNLIREDTGKQDAQRAELLAESWDAPIVITTFVQLLETLFGGKMSSVRRFHALCNSVIIIDEVQSLPNKMLTLFNCAINFLTQCCAATVVLCSATQPAFDLAEPKMLPHRMLPCEKLVRDDVLKRYSPLFRRTEILDCGTAQMTEIAQTAHSILMHADSLLIICNTKKEAAQMYGLLKKEANAEMFHLSAGMCMAHRRQITAQLSQALRARSKVICVSTQVIEAGIDVSFESVIRLSAGLDNVVQAAGRCNRHGEYGAPRPVRIYRLQEEKLGSLREIRAAQDALTALLGEYRRVPQRYNHELTSDAAVRDYYAFLYKDMPYGAQDYPTHGHTLFELLSFNHQFTPEAAPAYWLKQAFRTAGEWFEVFDDHSQSVLVPYQEGKEILSLLESDRARFDLGYAAELLEKAKPYSVSLSQSAIERMKKQGMLYTLLDDTINVLYETSYDAEIGVKEENGLCDTLIL